MKTLKTLLYLLLISYVPLAAQPLDTITINPVWVPGSNIEIEFQVADFQDIATMQFSINWDPTVLDYSGLDTSNISTFTDANIGTSFTDQGQLTVSWFDPLLQGVTFPDGSSIFSLSFIPLTNNSTPISITNTPIPIEITDINGNIYTLNTNSLNISPDGTPVQGVLFFDENDNCISDAGEQGLSNWMMEIQKDTNFWYVNTQSDGGFQLLLDTGAYTLTPIPPSNLWTNCQPSYNFTVGAQDTLVELEVDAQALADCPVLEVDLSAIFLRRCFENNYYIDYCNLGSAVAVNPYIEVTFDTFLTVTNTSVPIASQNGNTFTFEVDDLGINECGTIVVDVLVSCEAVLGQTHCSSAHIYPDTACIPPNPLWSGASIEVNSECEGDSLFFTIENTGNAAMSAPLNYIVIEDAVMLQSGPFDLDSGESIEIGLESTGSTYRIQADQEPFHPGSVSPTIALEGCGGEPFSIGFVTMFPENDADSYIDRDCQPNIGAYDPNDKQAHPTGRGDEHYIYRSTDLTYKIRFQNTGTDTAFTVRILDTLSQYLDLTTFRPGASSHNYTAQILDQNVVEFLFENIMLPDSNVNVEGSQGFVQFQIEPKADVPFWEEIQNRAGIYFDFNEPIITNTVLHTIEKPSAYQHIMVDLCEGETYEGVVYTESTTLEEYVDLTELDSFVYTHIHVSPTFQDTLNLQLAEGETYNGIEITGDTTLSFTYQTQAGCDSTVTAHIEVLISNQNRIHQNQEYLMTYPNPTEDMVVMDYYLQQTTEIRISVLTVDGRVVKTVQQDQNSGKYRKEINLSELQRGIYIIKLETSNHQFINKITKL